MNVMMFVTLAGGLGLFLFGMHLLGENLEQAVGARFKRILDTVTKNKYLGLLIGMLFTMVIQSSSATTVLVVGFVNAGLMNLFQATGVILGANIGTTITGQLIAFNLTKVAPVFLLAGVVLLLFFKGDTLRHVGGLIAGFGILFVGMGIMSDAMIPLRSYEPFIELMTKFSNPLLGILLGAAITGVIQSSSASVGILQVFANMGLISLESSIFIIMGQNIGTCITALLSSIGTNKTARRAAIIHLMFNFLGSVIVTCVILAFPHIYSFIGGLFAGHAVEGVTLQQLIVSLSPDNPARQIANAHTFFNIFCVLGFLPFTNQLVRISHVLVRGEDPSTKIRLEFLDDRILNAPPIAVAQAVREVERMGRVAIENFKTGIAFFFEGGAERLQTVQENEKVINFLNHGITRYLIKINQMDLNEPDGKLIGSLFHVINDWERIGDHAENLTEYATIKEENKLSLTASATEELTLMAEKTIAILERAQTIFSGRDSALLGDVLELEDFIDGLETQLRQSHIDRLNAGECSPQTGVVFIDMVTNLERVADHATNIAYSIVELTGKETTVPALPEK